MAVLITFTFASQVSAQVLVTGETGGKNNQAVFVSANGLFPKGLELLNTYGQFVCGWTDRFDVMVVYGNISALGETQNYVGFGWNANLLRRDQAFFDVSFFNVITTPLHRRDEASTVLTTPALVVSRPVTVGGRQLGLYTGLNATIPLGQVKDKLFTPPETFWNVPVGVSTNITSKWSLYVETDLGPNLKTVGLGLLKAF